MLNKYLFIDFAYCSDKRDIKSIIQIEHENVLMREINTTYTQLFFFYHYNSNTKDMYSVPLVLLFYSI